MYSLGDKESFKLVSQGLWLCPVFFYFTSGLYNLDVIYLTDGWHISLFDLLMQPKSCPFTKIGKSTLAYLKIAW